MIILVLKKVIKDVKIVSVTLELGGKRHELGFEKSNMTSKLLEHLHDRMNSLLVYNLYNALSRAMLLSFDD